MKKVFIVLLFLSAAVLFAAPIAAQARSDLEPLLKDADTIIRGFTRDSVLKTSFIVLAIAAGALVMMFQAMQKEKNKNFFKYTIIALGAVSAILAGVNERVLGMAAPLIRQYRNQAQIIKAEMLGIYSQMIEGGVPDRDQVTLFTEAYAKLLTLKNQYDRAGDSKVDVAERTMERPLGIGLGQKAYAAENPFWTMNNASFDNENMYFVGRGDGLLLAASKDLAAAKVAENAQTRIQEIIGASIPDPAVRAKVAAFIAGQAVVTDTFSMKSGNLFASWIKIRISKRLLDQYFLLFEVRNNVQIPEKTRAVTELQKSYR